MKKKRKQKFTTIILALLTLGILLTASFATQTTNLRQYASEITGEFVPLSMHHDRKTRNYLLRLPAGYDENSGSSYPMVFILHGGNSTAEDMNDVTSEMLPSWADRDNVILVFPNGYKKHWNDGNEDNWTRTRADDVGFITSLTEKIANEYNGDKDRAYFAGISEGGMMVARLLCEGQGLASSAIMGIASTASDVAQGCNPEQTSTMIINGTLDPIMPYDGGDMTTPGGFAYGEEVIATEDAFTYWSENINGGAYIIENLPDKDSTDGSTVQRWTSVGENNFRAVLYKVIGGGHTIPGGSQYEPEDKIGKVNRDVSATQILWDFFIKDTGNNNPTPTGLPTATSTPTSATTPTPTPASDNMLTVYEINLSTGTSIWGWRNITTGVTVVESAEGIPTENASISYELYHHEKNTLSTVNGETDSNGNFTHSFWTKETGTLTLTVKSVTKDGYTYNPTNTTKTIIVK